ncbi:MAG: hypothetical protein V1708_03480 [Candidatus Micrarchaeota archaeon]
MLAATGGSFLASFGIVFIVGLGAYKAWPNNPLPFKEYALGMAAGLIFIAILFGYIIAVN